MKTLNVKPTTVKEIEENWEMKLTPFFLTRELFIRCNSKGEVNWEVAPVYTKHELEERGSYYIIIVIDVDEIILNHS